MGHIILAQIIYHRNAQFIGDPLRITDLHGEFAAGIVKDCLTVKSHMINGLVRVIDLVFQCADVNISNNLFRLCNHTASVCALTHPGACIESALEHAALCITVGGETGGAGNKLRLTICGQHGYVDAVERCSAHGSGNGVVVVHAQTLFWDAFSENRC